MADEIKLRGIKSSNEDYTPISPMSLHGRRQIFTNETVITSENVVKVLNDALPTHNRNAEEERYLEKYLRGIQPVLERQKKYNDYVNNKVVANVANQIVTFKTAEFAGEPIQYVSRGRNKSVPEKVETLNSLMLSEGKQSKDVSLAYKMFTAGVGYRLVLRDKAGAVARGDLYDEAPFEVYTPDPQQTFVIRVNDVTRRVIAGVTRIFLTEDEVVYTVYTDNVTYKIKGTAQKASEIIERTVHNFGAVTLIEYPCNLIYMSPIEIVHDLLNALSSIMSNRVDGIEQFIQAIMVFEGVDIDRDGIAELKELGALKIPPSPDGRQGRVYYLNEQLDQSQTQTLVDDIYQTILQIVGMPSHGNGNTGDSSNNGAVIMKNGWWDAEARALETEGMWRESETQFLKVALKICDEAGVLSGLSASDVQVKFGRHSYEDKLVKTQSFTTLIDAKVPPIQAYTISGMVTDPESAAMEYEEYQEKLAQELDDLPETVRTAQTTQPTTPELITNENDDV